MGHSVTHIHLGVPGREDREHEAEATDVEIMIRV